MRFYCGNALILHPWRENLIKQCDSTVRATPARVVDGDGAPPCSAARPHTGGSVMINYQACVSREKGRTHEHSLDANSSHSQTYMLLFAVKK